MEQFKETLISWVQPTTWGGAGIGVAGGLTEELALAIAGVLIAFGGLVVQALYRFGTWRLARDEARRKEEMWQLEYRERLAVIEAKK